MSQSELLNRVLNSLEAVGVAYMLSGSYASSLQAEPRSTHDIDIVVSITTHAAEFLRASFTPPNYYLDEHAMAQAIAGRSQFNLIDLQSGDNVDFWMLTDEPFDQSRFRRRLSLHNRYY